MLDARGFFGVPAVGGLQFSMAQRKSQKVPVRGNASWAIYSKNLTLGRTIFSNFV